MTSSKPSEPESHVADHQHFGNTWVLATKRVGDIIAGWRVAQRFDDDTRLLSSSERCQVTSFCYPTGAKLVRAQLVKDDPESL